MRRSARVGTAVSAAKYSARLLLALLLVLCCWSWVVHAAASSSPVVAGHWLVLSVCGGTPIYTSYNSCLFVDLPYPRALLLHSEQVIRLLAVILFKMRIVEAAGIPLHAICCVPRACLSSSRPGFKNPLSLCPSLSNFWKKSWYRDSVEAGGYPPGY